MGFRNAKRLNAQFTFYLHVDLPLSYTTHLLDPIEPLSLNFTAQIFICKKTVEQEKVDAKHQSRRKKICLMLQESQGK